MIREEDDLYCWSIQIDIYTFGSPTTSKITPLNGGDNSNPSYLKTWSKVKKKIVTKRLLILLKD